MNAIPAFQFPHSPTAYSTAISGKIIVTLPSHFISYGQQQCFLMAFLDIEIRRGGVKTKTNINGKESPQK